MPETRGDLVRHKFSALMRDHLNVSVSDEDGHAVVSADVIPLGSCTLTPEHLRRLAGTLLELADTIDT